MWLKRTTMDWSNSMQRTWLKALRTGKWRASSRRKSQQAVQDSRSWRASMSTPAELWWTQLGSLGHELRRWNERRDEWVRPRDRGDTQVPRYPRTVNDWQSRCLPDRKSQQGAAHLSCG